MGVLLEATARRPETLRRLIERATRELSLAAAASASRSERDLYSAKADWLRAQRAR